MQDFHPSKRLEFGTCNDLFPLPDSDLDTIWIPIPTANQIGSTAQIQIPIQIARYRNWDRIQNQNLDPDPPMEINS